MKYAVIKSGGKQYRVSEGDILEIDKLELKDDKVVFKNVLLVAADDSVLIGKPLVENAKVFATLLEQKKGIKVRVAKFKSKVRYRRVAGFRAMLSKIQIEKIESSLKEVKNSPVGEEKKAIKKLPIDEKKPKKVSKKS